MPGVTSGFFEQMGHHPAKRGVGVVGIRASFLEVVVRDDVIHRVADASVCAQDPFGTLVLVDVDHALGTRKALQHPDLLGSSEVRHEPDE